MSYTGQEIVMCHDHKRPEETQHIEEYVMLETE